MLGGKYLGKKVVGQKFGGPILPGLLPTLHWNGRGLVKGGGETYLPTVTGLEEGHSKPEFMVKNDERLTDKD